jgi:hypothetical protein
MATEMQNTVLSANSQQAAIGQQVGELQSSSGPHEVIRYLASMLASMSGNRA